MDIRKAIAVFALASSLAGCGAIDLISKRMSYSKAVAADLERAAVREVVAGEFKQTPDMILPVFSLDK
jgi:hypothetical protein